MALVALGQRKQDEMYERMTDMQRDCWKERECQAAMDRTIVWMESPTTLLGRAMAALAEIQ